MCTCACVHASVYMCISVCVFVCILHMYIPDGCPIHCCELPTRCIRARNGSSYSMYNYNKGGVICIHAL